MSISPPAAPPVHRMLPDEPLLLMGAGPTPIPHAVARANAVVINHLGPTMNRVVEGVKDLARYAFQTEAEHVLGVAGPASAANEMALGNLAWPGRRVLCLVTGTFSARLAEMARGVGADVTVVESEVGQPATAAQTAEALSRGRYDLVTLVQGETSCGVVNHEIPEIARLAREHGALVLIDAVCTLSTMPLPMDAWGLDVVVTGGQKGLASIPGVSLIALSDRAWEAVEARPRPMPHWCLDATRAWKFWGDHQYHYTAPVPGVLAVYEALRLIAEETLEARFARHARCSAALAAAVEAMGMSLLIPAEHRLSSVLAIRRPAPVDATALKARMVRDYGVEIAGAFGLDIVRIGQMGEQCRAEHLFRCVHAFGESLHREGFDADVAAGMAALSGALEAGGRR
jgi:alanine-glyoxylate transaminase / serine-glyoxylate transaminase / serine-pyruvate transaminase